MINIMQSLFKQDKEKYTIPRCVRDVIPIRCVWPDGIFKVGTKYSMSWSYTDINFSVASEEDKVRMVSLYGTLLNGFEKGMTVKFSTDNHMPSRSNFEAGLLMAARGDALDALRHELNEVITSVGTESSGVTQKRYVTITVYRETVAEARSFFTHMSYALASSFMALGSKCEPLNATQRLRILHSFYRYGEEDSFSFDMKRMARLGHDFRDYICPDSIERHSDYLMLGKRYCRVLYLKDYASRIEDDFLKRLTDVSSNMMLSIDVLPEPAEEAIRNVERTLLGVESNIANWQRRQNASNNFSALVPYDMELQRQETKLFLDGLVAKDQRMMLVVLTMVLSADSKEQLERETEALCAAARERNCQIVPLTYQQTDGLNTVLPIGESKIKAYRTLNTDSLSILMPFKVQEITEKGGIYLGVNAISHNLIMCNRENLMNQSAILLGVPGSGKSFLAKLMILLNAMNSDDDILICDPEGEYTAMLKQFGELCSFLHIAAGGKDKLNAMEMTDSGDSDAVVSKSQFIMSLIEQIDKRGVGSQHKSIIDRCVLSLFRDAKAGHTVPTLCTLREELLKQPEAEAQEIALALELFTTGSLDIFGHESNVNLRKRIVVYDIHGLGEQLKPAGLLVITDAMLNRVRQNWKAGKRTHIFIDEFHVVYENEYSAAFFNSAWRQFRKRGCWPTAITQNVEYLLDSVQASTMLSNSEFIIMLNQASSDREKLAKLLNISAEQLSYITDADVGCGLIRYGRSLVPFENRFPHDTQLYRMMTTKPGEGAFAGGQA